MAVGDINKDENPDILVANACGKDATCKSSGTASVLVGDGKGNFKPAAELPLGNAPTSIALADLTGRGVLDLLVSRSADNTLAVLRGNGDASFKGPVVYPVGNGPSSVTVADFNGDGKADIAVANFNDSTTSVLFGNGDGSLQTAFSLPVGAGPQALAAVAGKNGGHASLVTANGKSAPLPGGAASGESLTAAVQEKGSAQLTAADSSGSASPPGSEITVLANITPDADPPPIPTTTTVTLTTGANPSTVNDTLVFTAAVTPFNGVPLSDTVTWAITGGDGKAVNCLSNTAFVPATGLATCTVNALTVKTNTITATYNADGNDTNYVKSTGTLTQTVNAAPTTTTVTLTTGANPSTVNDTLVFTAAVTPFNGVPLSDTVTWAITGGDGKAVNCLSNTAFVPATGLATCTVNALTVKTNTITATYNADGNDTNYVKSTGTLTQTVNAAPTTTTVTLTTGANPSTVNDTLVFTAAVTPFNGVPLSDTVTWAITGGDGKAVNCLSNTAFVPATGLATCTVNALTVKTNTITATYNADGNDTNYVKSTGTLTQTVNAAPTTTTVTLTTGANPSTVNDTLVFTAAVTPFNGTVPLSGTVTWAITGGDGKAVNCLSNTAFVPATGLATCTVNALTAGSNTVSATYNADGKDANYVKSTGTLTPSQTVNPAPTTTTLASTLSSSNLNQSVTFTATVAPTIEPVLLSGKVIFTDNGATIAACGTAGAVAVNPLTGAAACSTASLPAGSHSIVATYNGVPVGGGPAPAGGDPNYIVSNNNVPLLVATAASTTVVAASSTTPTVNQSVTFTATVTPINQPVPLSGTVTFTLGGNPLAGCNALPIVVATGQQTCTTTALVLGLNMVEAVYAGDPSYTTSNATVKPNVGQGVTSLALASANVSPTPLVNQSVTFTATVTFPSGLTGLSGSVAFKDGVTPIAGCAAVSPAVMSAGTGKAACPTAALTAGAHAITATYSNDQNFTTSNATLTPQQMVNPAPSTTMLQSSSSTSATNQSVTFTAAVTPFNAIVPLSGSVTFTDNGNAIAACPVSPASPVTGIAVCATAALSVGSHTIVATYNGVPAGGGSAPPGGDPNYQISTAMVTQIVGQASTSLMVSSSLPSAAVNQPVTFTAAITAPSGTATLTGTVAFTDNANPISGCGSVVPAPSGQASCTTSALTAGTHSIVGTYSHDSAFSGSTGQLNQTVLMAPSSTALTSTTSNSSVDQAVTFTATVTPSTGTVPLSGTVTFADNGTAIAGCGKAGTVAVNPTTGVATCQTSALPLGQNAILATYSDSNYSTSTGQTAQNVQAAATTTTVPTATPSPSLVNQPVTFSATVMPAPPSFAGAGLALPNGAISFSSGTTTLCSATVQSNGTATCTTPVAPAGTYVIAAAYTSSDGNFLASASTTSLTQTVTASATSLSLMSSLPTSVATQLVTFIATVTPTTLGNSVPSGTVAFSSPDGTANKTCGAVAVTPSPTGKVSTAPCSVMFATTTGGTFNVTAAYSGDNNFGSSSSPVTQTVQNFSVAFSVQAGGAVGSGPVSVTQGYSNVNDPFTSASITANSTPVALFTDTLTVACTVTATGSTTPVSDPSCVSTLGSTMSSTLRGDGTAPLTFTLAPSATAPVGSYTVILTATDNTNPTLVQVAPPLIVNVVSQSAPLSLSPGVTGVTTAIFTGTAGTQLSSFSCPTIKNAIDGSTVMNSGITCSGPSGGFMLTGNQDKVPITIGTGTVTLARSNSPAQTSNAISTASLLGLPFLVLAGWLGRRKMPSRHLARFLSLMVLIIFLSQAIGCGSNGFTTPPKPTGGTPAGSYLVQVIATDSSNNQYFAVVPLNVN